VTLCAALFAGCIGLGYAGVVGAAIAVLAVIGFATHAARFHRVRRMIDHQAEARARAKRECQRQKLLRPTGPTRQQHYEELRALVEHVERLDQAEAARFELQDLLDHYIRIAINHQRCSDALRMAGANTLPAAPTDLPARSRRRRDLMQRRIRHRDECTRQIQTLADELEATDELIRLVAQRAACPALDNDIDREIDRRLWELDELDHALDQLSA
jgi:hypothetical protein